MIEIKLPLNTNRKPLSLFELAALRTVINAPQRSYIDDVIFGLQENLIISEMVYDRRKMYIEHN